MSREGPFIVPLKLLPEESAELPLKSYFAIYSSTTRPNPSTLTGEFPSIPSLSGSTQPDSMTSKHPSPSESRSNEFIIPSPSASPSPS